MFVRLVEPTQGSDFTALALTPTNRSIQDGRGYRKPIIPKSSKLFAGPLVAEQLAFAKRSPYQAAAR